MDHFTKFLLLLLNTILVAAISYHLVRPVPQPIPQPAPQPAPQSVLTVRPESTGTPAPSLAQQSPQVVVDMRPVVAALSSVERAVNALSADVHRLNTSAIQFAYINREIERMGQTNQLVAERILKIQAEPPKSRTVGMLKALEQLEALKKKIDAQIAERSQLLMQLVQKLENGFSEKHPTSNKTPVGTAPAGTTPGRVNAGAETNNPVPQGTEPRKPVPQGTVPNKTVPQGTEPRKTKPQGNRTGN